MNLLFCCHDFRQENLRLMPWRYLDEMVKGLSRRCHQVSIISLEHSPQLRYENIGGIKVFKIDKKKLLSGDTLRDLASMANIIVWSASSLTAFYYQRFKQLGRPLLLLYTGPFYNLQEILRAQRSLVPFRQLSSHYKQALVPLNLTAALINSSLVKKAIVLSKRNADILQQNGCRNDKVIAIPPGYEGPRMVQSQVIFQADVRKKFSLPQDGKILTYLGSLYQIRGVHLLLEAFAEASKVIPKLLLLLLARTESQTEIDHLYHRATKLGIKDNILLIKGFLGKDAMVDYLTASDVVVLPFILVPSDMPLGALEAMALGKPVIATEIDGMSEMVAGRGVAVPPGDASALSQAMCALFRDGQLYDTLRSSCLDYMSHYPSWERITDSFEAIIGSQA